MRVGALSDETLGQPGFVSLDAAADLVGGQVNRFNALYLTADPKRGDRIQDEIYDMPDAASVQVKAGLVARLKSLLELFNVFGTVLLVFGGALAFVVVFTTFTANVAERTREIATMRTIGEDNGRLTADDHAREPAYRARRASVGPVARRPGDGRHLLVVRDGVVHAQAHTSTPRASCGSAC